MEVDRRSLMKGILASGALLVWGFSHGRLRTSLCEDQNSASWY